LIYPIFNNKQDESIFYIIEDGVFVGMITKRASAGSPTVGEPALRGESKEESPK
jgi:hypothetical protein